jgi:hypothetical protein
MTTAGSPPSGPAASQGTTPSALLAETDRLLREVVPGTRGVWPRACAWLLRLALERALDDFWRRTNREVAAASMRAQLIVLTRYLGPRTVSRVEQLWVGLSRAGHQHAYELAPTAAELRRWHGEVVAAVATLESAG